MNIQLNLDDFNAGLYLIIGAMGTGKTALAQKFFTDWCKNADYNIRQQDIMTRQMRLGGFTHLKFFNEENKEREDRMAEIERLLYLEQKEDKIRALNDELARLKAIIPKTTSVYTNTSFTYQIKDRFFTSNDLDIHELGLPNVEKETFRFRYGDIIIIEEAPQYFDSRRWQKMKTWLRKMLPLIRQFGLKVFVITQAIDLLDKSFRDLANGFIYIDKLKTKYLINFKVLNFLISHTPIIRRYWYLQPKKMLKNIWYFYYASSEELIKFYVNSVKTRGLKQRLENYRNVDYYKTVFKGNIFKWYDTLHYRYRKYGIGKQDHKDSNGNYIIEYSKARPFSPIKHYDLYNEYFALNEIEMKKDQQEMQEE